MTEGLTRTISQAEFDSLFGAALASLQTWQLHDAVNMMEEAVMNRMGSLPQLRRFERKNRRRKDKRSTKTREKMCRQRLRSNESWGDGKRWWENYDEYLKSPEWKAIRTRIFARDRSKCLACGNHADAVHHRGYDKETMIGQRLHMLISVCRECHEHIHFLPDGEKLPSEIVDIRLSELRIANFGESDHPVGEDGIVNWKALLKMGSRGRASVKGAI